MHDITKYHDSPAEGSLRALQLAQGTSLQNVFFHNVTHLVILDSSMSMDCHDLGYEGTRHDRAEEELRRIQADYPGAVALIEFSTTVAFRPDGLPWRLNGGTHLREALEFVRPADGTGIEFIVISDGAPMDSQGCLNTAKTFETKIHAIFIGSEGDSGQDFLRELSRVSGGTYQSEGAGVVENPVRKILTLTAGNNPPAQPKKEVPDEYEFF